MLSRQKHGSKTLNSLWVLPFGEEEDYPRAIRQRQDTEPIAQNVPMDSGFD
jgi:hypothetical protein